jgi:hypothetical protein
MDENRKRAYRDLLYFAMLDLRRHTAVSPYTYLQWWNPKIWTNAVRRLRMTMIIADWMHNLAMFSAHDFREFDEERFWRQYKNISKRWSDAVLSGYQKHFENQLTRLQPIHDGDETEASI